ncbi:ATP-binding protein [Subsaximicrobium wynnwilliamsii]|uniref:ATP-binding protein n=1 Tax=Subsaximicrobium wynnwilliamsii TaxID=291179 RepID=A0A5C6ZKS7_9FLAO|nr:ATP-binding protein [Subsaximicrobium wynnwilliamsii]TXD84945.1 ATP-binding protein [Subsaximicrobium wynnwilliamsii]TXD90616.1 ATP-binding protein [Subsaximicrobium wynnwilliamsii]TXE05090.1 ATP-binding protein [Subsaximicrobium wynnwilliamsii]
MQSPLDNDIIVELMKTKANGRLYKRESTALEFKSDFDWDIRESRIKYLKSIASFANRLGGYMIFGVSDSPRLISGITKSFMEIDDYQISQFINLYLSPAPDFEREEFLINGKKIGVMFIHPIDRKPVVCIKSYGNIMSDSSIYYRYNSLSCIINSGDLIHLLEEAKQKENDKWMKLFTSASTVGVHNAGIFDIKSGKISTQKGNSYVLDENLLKRLKVLDKYSQQEDGAEAVRIIGEIDKTGTVINRPFAIHDDDIIIGFLGDKDINAPIEYLEAMCYQSSGFMPIYYYINKTDFNIEDILKKLKKVKTRSQAKKKLIARLEDDSNILNQRKSLIMENSTSVRTKRLRYHNQLINGEEIIYKNTGEVKRLLEAICNLQHGTFNFAYVKNVLIDVYNNYFNTDLSSFIRKTVCYLDLLENKN